MRISIPHPLSASLAGFLLGFAAQAIPAVAQTTVPNEWTWMGGSSTTNQSGVYGTLGTPAVGNVPGSRWYASSWIDNDGNFWVFGGDGYDALGQENDLNDFWEFNPVTSEWVWMGGDSTLPCTSFGQCGEYAGKYGTLGTPSEGNAPGSRDAATSWTDSSGNFWLFGGGGIDSVGLPDNGWLNDLWEYTPSTNEWAWVSGSNTLTCVWELGGYCGVPGQYNGTAGYYVDGNVPAGRFGAMGWTDNKGSLWLFGGMTMVEAGVDTYLNDLWEFNPSTKEWTWMGGNSAAPCLQGVACSGASGVYGTLGTPSETNLPGAREFGATWTDGSGNLWLFGGQGMVADGGNYLNDLWEFNPSTNYWTWMGGSDTLSTQGGAPGVYGTLGKPATGNFPGSREYASSWTDGSGNLWLFGGYGFDANGVLGNLNDLWEFNPSTNQWAWMSGSDSSGSSGVYGTSELVVGEESSGRHSELSGATHSTADATSRTATAGYTPGGRMNALGWTDRKGNLWLFGGSNGANSYLNDLWEYPLSSSSSLSAAATPVFSPAAGAYTSTQSVIITDTTPGAVIYYTTDGITTPTISSTQYTGPIVVAATETIQAIAVATNYANSAIANATYTIPPDFTIAINPASLSVLVGESGTATITVQDEGGFNSNVSFACSGLPAGAACSFVMQTAPTPAGVTYTTLTVTTAASSAALRRNSSPLIPASALAAAFCFIGWKKRRRLPMLLLLALSVAGMGLLGGCSSAGTVSDPPPVTSTVTVTATGGSIAHSTSFTLITN